MGRKDVFLSISRPGFNVRLWGYLAVHFSWCFFTLHSLGSRRVEQGTLWSSNVALPQNWCVCAFNCSKNV